MQSFVIFIQRLILWCISLVVAGFAGFVGGALYEEHKHKETEPEEEPTSPIAMSPSSIRIIYDEKAKNWTEDSEINRMFVRNVRSLLNDRLKINGHVFLNEIYDELGLRRTYAGQLWVWNEGPIEIELGEFSESGSVPLTLNIEGNILDSEKTWATLWPED